MSDELIDPAHASRDLRLVTNAVRRGWAIPDSTKQRLVEVVTNLIDDPDPKVQINAGRLLVAMNGQDQKEQPAQARRVKHTHKVVASQVVTGTEGNIDQRRRLLSERLEAIAGDSADQ